MRTRNRILLAGILLMFIWLGSGLVMADTVPRAALVRQVVGSGGRPTTGQRIALNGTLGQPVVGTSISPGVTLRAGYWQARERTPADIPTTPVDNAVYLPLVIHSIFLH